MRHTPYVPLSAIQLAVISTDDAHVCRKRGRKGRGQDSDEAYTDDEAISESDSDDDRLPTASAQEASADDLSSGKTQLPMSLQSLLLCVFEQQSDMLSMAAIHCYAAFAQWLIWFGQSDLAARMYLPAL
jgi:hypothetical protein